MNALNKIADNYHKLPVPLKASLWFTFCSIMQKGISFITNPIFTRILTTSEFGICTIYQSWLNLFGILATFYLQYDVYNRGIIKYGKHVSSFTSSLLGLISTLTGVCFLIYSLSAKFWNRILGLPSFLIIMMLLEIWVTPSIVLWTTQKRFKNQYLSFVAITLFQTLFTASISIIAVLLSRYKPEAKILSTLVGQALIGLICYIQIMKAGKTFYNYRYWKFALLFALPLLPHYLSQAVLLQADRIIIQHLCGIDKAGIYSVAYSLALLMTIINSSINNAFVPWLYKSLESHSYKSIMPVMETISILIGGFTLLLIAIAPELMQFLYTENYYEAVWSIPPVALSVYVMFLYTYFTNIEIFYEQKLPILLISIGVALINIILNYLCIPIWGYVAAGYTTLASYILITGVHSVVLRRLYKKHNLESIGYINGKFFLINALLFIFSLILLLLYNYLFVRYTILLFILILFFINRRVIIRILNKKCFTLT